MDGKINIDDLITHTTYIPHIADMIWHEFPPPTVSR
jgi:hypothetical protein